jgi:hypothetical protein
MLQHPQLRTDPDLAVFLQLTESLEGSAQQGPQVRKAAVLVSRGSGTFKLIPNTFHFA